MLTPKENGLKATDEDLIAAYRDLSSVWKVADRFGMAGQTVHERLQRLGVTNPKRVFTESERRQLQAEYLIYREAGKLGELAARMERTKPFICRQAKALGLTNYKHARPYIGVWKYMTDEAKELLLNEWRGSGLPLATFCAHRKLSKVGFWQTMSRDFPAEYESILEANTNKTSQYKRGRSFEYRVRNDLRKRGFFVLRSPQSRSAVDLVAIKRGSVLFVQCKLRGAIAPGEWNALYDLCESTGATPILAQRVGLKGVRLSLMTARKLTDGSKKAQPMRDVELGSL